MADCIQTEDTHEDSMDENDTQELLPMLNPLSPMFTDKSPDEKLNYILTLCISHSTNMVAVQTDLKKMKTSLGSGGISLQEKTAMKEQIQSAQGKIARLEQKETALNEKIIDLQESINQNNVVFYNIEEKGSQTPILLRDFVYGVLKTGMEIPEE